MGAAKHGEIVKALKTEHGLGHGYANLVAHHAKGDAKPAGDEGGDLVDAMFAGPKAGLRPIYDSLIAEVRTFGPDVEIAPKKTYVSLRRSKQFGLVQPTTKARVDVGINLKGSPPAGPARGVGFLQRHGQPSGACRVAEGRRQGARRLAAGRLREGIVVRSGDVFVLTRHRL